MRRRRLSSVFEIFIKIDANDADAWHGLGIALSINGDNLAEAEDAYRRAVESQPQLAEAWYDLGNLLRLQGKLEPAKDAFFDGHSNPTELRQCAHI